MRARDLIRSCALLALLAAAGCSSNPVKAWQASLTEYVVEQGNGDLNVLRSIDRSPTEGDFSLIGAARGGIWFASPRRTDATGVLLGRRVVDDHGWYVYLLGMVQYRGTWVDWPLDDARLTDVRLVAVSGPAHALHWRISDPDPEALDLYRAPQIEAWRRSDPSRAAADDAPITFPTAKDRFRLSVEADAFSVVDEHSQARWTLPPKP